MKITKVKAVGLEASEAQHILMIMVNVEASAKHDYGHVFCASLETIRTTFKYNYKHNTTLLKTVLELLAAADTHRKMHNAPAPTELQANAVSSRLATLCDLVQDNMTINIEAPSDYNNTCTATSEK